MRASYKRAVEWIAHNDEPNEMDVDEMDGLISVLLVADLWGKEARDVAKAVIRLRRKEGMVTCSTGN